MAHDDRFFTLVCCAALIITGVVFLWTHHGFIRFQTGSPTQASLGIEQASATPTIAQTINTAAAKPVSAGRTGDAPAAIPAVFVPEVAASVVHSPIGSPDGPSPDQVLGFVEAVIQLKSPRFEGWDLPALAEVLVRRDSDGRLVVAPGTHRRYDQAREVIISLDGPTVAAACDAMEHSLAMGIPGEDLFRTKVIQALDLLIAPELPNNELDMVSRGSYWGFSDPGLDDLSPAQKHMLLMGLDNQRIVRATLEGIRQYLGGTPTAASPSDPSFEESDVLIAQYDRPENQDQDQITEP